MADEHLNTNSENSIAVIRLRDFIFALKEAGFKGEECQLLWLVASFDPVRKEESRKWAKKSSVKRFGE